MAFTSRSGSDKGTPAKAADGSSSKSGQAAFLGAGSKVVGKINFTGPAVLSGHVEGEIKADSRLEVGESAVITAKVEGADIVVKGTIQGDVVATSKLELFRSGKIVGNVSCASIQIEDGAVFEGSCKMINRTAKTATVVGSTSDSSPAAVAKSVS